jgi:hypothetical protein
MQLGRTKRQKEQTRADHQKDKEARRELRKQAKAAKPIRKPGDPDPDLEGLVAGPQPLQDWQKGL